MHPNAVDGDRPDDFPSQDPAAGVAGLLGAYKLRPGRSPAEDAQTGAAIGNMDEAQSVADAGREEKRSAAALL